MDFYASKLSCATAAHLCFFVFFLTLQMQIPASNGCEEDIPVKILKATSPTLAVEILGQHTIKVDARKQAVKDLSGGSSGASGGNGGAGGSDQQNTLSDESASAITKREANPNHLLSPQYIDIVFDSVYIVKSYKVKSKEQVLSLQYSRPGDAVPFTSRLYTEKGSAELTVNEYMPFPSYFFQTKLKPPFVMKNLRISFIRPLYHNKSSPADSPNFADEMTFSFKAGLLCQFNTLESYTITEPFEDHPDVGYDGKAVKGFLKDGLGSLVFNGGSESQYVEWIKKSDESKVEMNFAFRLKQNVTSLTLNFDKATYELYSPETVTCYAQLERHSDISKGASASAVVPTYVDSLEMSLGFIAHNVHCEMFYRSSEQSIRLKSVKFDSRNATAAEIDATNPDKAPTLSPLPDGSEGDGGDTDSPSGGGGDSAGGDGNGADGASGAGGGSSNSGDKGGSDKGSGSGSGGNKDSDDPTISFFDNSSMKYLTLIILVMASLCGVVLTIVAVGIGWICYRRKKLQLKKKYESAYVKGEFFGSGPPTEHPYQALSQLDQYETPRYHMNATLDIAGRQLPDIPPMSHHPHPEGSIKNYRTVNLKLSQKRCASNPLFRMAPPPELRNSSHTYSSPNVTPYVESIGGSQSNCSQRTEPFYWSLASSRIYTEPDLVSQIRDQPTLTRGAGGGDSLARNVARAYAETDITQIQEAEENAEESGIFGGTFEMNNVLEYPKNNLIFLKELGKGQFATVHLCVAPGILDGNPETQVKVAVKFLHPDALYEQREAFKKEVKVLSDLRHPNIIMLYGVCTRTGPPMMILEYMENGDLYQFLRRHEPEMAAYATSSNIQTLSGATLIYMARQIASGMAHVESVNFIHRDLASRNCLVGLAYTVKIGDFGMSRELYSNDYYKIEGKAVLPIRWMAWESIVMGKFSNKSDVWSFGVLLWELFTLAKCQPFSNRSDEQVIENLTNIWENKSSETLPQPTNCPSEVFELMKKCWHSSPDLRPNFQEISSTLTKITQDYSISPMALNPNLNHSSGGAAPTSPTLPSLMSPSNTTPAFPQVGPASPGSSGSGSQSPSHLPSTLLNSSPPSPPPMA